MVKITVNDDQHIAHPMAMILAGTALLTYAGTPACDLASRSIYESIFKAIYEGNATPDLGGQMSTTDFTEEIIRKVKTKLEVWSTLKAT
ncbi:MAG: isocitrate/isopropylmalate family dehydrogenase [Cyanobacteria bacterium P01_A01_bin.37]